MENETLENRAAPEQSAQPNVTATKFCKNCGGKIAEKAVVCPLCGCQIEEIKSSASVQQPQIVINNANSNVNQNNVGVVGRRTCNKWIALLLCLFLGMVGGHKFYEGKIGMGILYLFTGGLFFIGVVIDFIAILFKPNPYYI